MTVSLNVFQSDIFGFGLVTVSLLEKWRYLSILGTHFRHQDVLLMCHVALVCALAVTALAQNLVILGYVTIDC